MNKILLFVLFAAPLLAMPPKKPGGKSKGSVSSAARHTSKRDLADEALLAQAESEANAAQAQASMAQAKQTRRNQELPLAKGFSIESAFWWLTGYLEKYEEDLPSSELFPLSSRKKTEAIPEGGISMAFWKGLYTSAFESNAIHVESVGLLHRILQKHGPESWKSTQTMQKIKGILNLPNVLNSKPGTFYEEFKRFAAANEYRDLFRQLLRKKLSESDIYYTLIHAPESCMQYWFYMLTKNVEALKKSVQQHYGLGLFHVAWKIEEKESTELFDDILPNLIGTVENYYEAPGKLYALAARGGMPQAYYNLALSIQNNQYSKDLDGNYTPKGKRYEIVGDLCVKATKGGVPQACHSLANLIIEGQYDKGANGKKLPEGKRYEVAGDLYSQAAKRGVPQACYNLAVLIKKGKYHKDLDNNQISDSRRYEVVKSLYMRALEFSEADSTSHHKFIKNFILAIADQPDAEVEFARIMQHPKVPTQYRPFYEALLSALKREDFDFEKANLALQTGYEDAFILYCLWQEMSQERQAQAVSQIPEDQNQEQEDLVQKTPSESDDDTFSDEDSPEGLEMAGAAAAEGSATQSKEESQEIQAYTIPKTQREAVKQKTIKAVRDAKESFMSKKLAPISAEPRPSVRITWSEEARADLKTLTQEMGQAFRSDRLPLLLETLKEFQCAGANSIEVLKHAKHNGKRVFSGRIDREHRLCATRTYDNKGNVTGIHLLSLSGHY